MKWRRSRAECRSRVKWLMEKWRPYGGHDTVPPVPTSPRSLARRAETWLWTGPAGHLLGGTLDFLVALARYLHMRRTRLRR